MINISVVHKYDSEVIIIGGGPSGSCLAYHLASEGVEVTVIEAKKFPRDKTCGDAVSSVAISQLEAMGITDLESFKSFNEIKKVALFVENERIDVTLDGKDKPKGRVIPRYLLDNWIYEAAKAKGAKYIENTRLIDFFQGDGYVVAHLQDLDGRKRYLKSKVLVGADGSNSTVARKLHRGKPSDDFRLLGLRAYYKGVNGPVDQCDIFFSKSNFPGLFWYFPIGANEANVGSAMIASTVPKNDSHVKQILNHQIKTDVNFANRIGNGHINGKISGWPLKFRNPEDSVVDNGVLLIGDAAGLINPLSGDGIQYALLSARWAAECLVECHNKNDFSLSGLQWYNTRLEKETAYDIALSSLLVQITRNRSLTGLWLEVLQILFDRAREDKEYAEIIAGIFDGSYPSYKVMDPTFLSKSILQGVIKITEGSTDILSKGPESWFKIANGISQGGIEMIKSVNATPADQIHWLLQTAKNTLTVGKHSFKHFREESNGKK